MAAIVLCVCCSISSAAANRVCEIAIDVTLYSDGSAYIVQTWNGSFQAGSECAFPVTLPANATLDHLIVSDGNGHYQTLHKWNPDASFEEKIGKCGLQSMPNGSKVCWGISQYGNNRYAVEYQLGGLVSAYADYDGFLLQFIPSGMDPLPADITVRILTQGNIPLTEKNTAIWQSGFDGQIDYTGDGKSILFTQSPLTDKDETVNLLFRLQKGILMPAHTAGGSFNTLKALTFSGTDSDRESSCGSVTFLLLLAVPVIFGLLLWLGGIEERKVKKLYDAANYFREAPLAGNLEAAHTLARQFYQSDSSRHLITAVLMKLFAEGCLAPIGERELGFTNGSAEAVCLRLVMPPDFSGVTARELYALLTQAAGVDWILREQEWECTCKQNPQAISHILQEAQHSGKETLIGIGCYKSADDTNRLRKLSERGLGQLINLMGFKKYLLNFPFMGEQGISETVVWQDYLIFSTLLGIGDQVMEQFGKLYPDGSVYRQRAQAAYLAACRFSRIACPPADGKEKYTG